MRDSLSLYCKCFGLTATCSVEVCTRYLPTEFSKLAAKLFQLNKNAVQVDLDKSGSRKELVIKNRKQGEKSKKLRTNDMAYLIKSRDFCLPVSNSNLPGTKGRVCGQKFIGNFKKPVYVDTKTINVCDYLCCGRGYITTTNNIELPNRCGCKFYFEIMDVKCKKCNVKKKETYFCK